jgi:TIR domain/Pentapeptide repeats (8 copies)
LFDWSHRLHPNGTLRAGTAPTPRCSRIDPYGSVPPRGEGDDRHDVAMANPEHVQLLRQGLEALCAWRETNQRAPLQLIEADLKGLVLNGANLWFADVTGADLRNTQMQDARLWRAVMRGADLRGADLRSAQLDGADLSGADLRGADLQRAHLHGATFNECVVGNANLMNASIGLTVWINVDLSEARGLDTIHHVAPSVIGVETLYLSHGKIPDIFLRGCGLPESIVTYVGSLMGRALEYFSCFISFTNADDDFTERLYNDLQAAGVRCWRWREDARWGRALMGEIDRAIRVYDKLIVVCSEHSLNAEPVIREIERALKREQREGKEVLFPIRLDDAVFASDHHLQADLASRYIGDFRDWRTPASYWAALARLIRDLRSAA